MDTISPRANLDNNNKTLLPSPHSSNSNSSSSSSTNGLHHTQQFAPLSPTTPATPLLPPKPITRSESGSTYPTTFVQADSSSFKQVVQMLTGCSDTAKQPSKTHIIPPIKTMPTKQPHHQSGFKLYERRNKSLSINPLLPSLFNHSAAPFSPRNPPEALSPSILDFPSLVLSPVTPLIPDPFVRSGYRYADNGGTLDTGAEERAIKEKGFFLHPSPATTPRDAEPRLLPLFPTTSPKAASGSPSSN